MSDLISRRVTVEHFQRIKDEHEAHSKHKDCCKKYTEGFIDGVDYCISFISLLPSAEPEQKTGAWWETVNSHCTCSVCDSQWSFFENETERFVYCPNCGAKME